MQSILELLVAFRVFFTLLNILSVLAVQLISSILAVKQVLMLAIQLLLDVFNDLECYQEQESYLHFLIQTHDDRFEVVNLNCFLGETDVCVVVGFAAERLS